MAVDWRAVGDRIRGLVSASDQANLALAAQRLRVSESQLRDAVNDRWRVASMNVVVAVVIVYGLDPTWVLTGTYDSATHRTALEGDRAEIELLVKRLVTDGARVSGEFRARDAY